jgi:UDP-glucose 4-epimerase
LIVGIVGARSRSAVAFRKFVEANAPDVGCRSFIRGTAAPGEAANGSEVTVSDYDRISPDMLAGCDAVINFVGVVGTKNYAELHRLNVTVPERLVEASMKAHVGHFIQMSSLSLHGPLPWIDRNAPLRPTNDYGRSKLEAETAIAQTASDLLAVTLLRVPTIYGVDGPSKLRTLARILRRVPVIPAPSPLPARSVISHANLSRVLLHILQEKPRGVVYAADPQPFALDMMARVVPGRHAILKVPGALLKPLSWIAPGAYVSLYESGEIDPNLLVQPFTGSIPTEQALTEAFGQQSSDTGA